MTMATLARSVTGGVDTHLEFHVVAALDERGALLAVETFETTIRGYKKLLGWLVDFGPVVLVGVEGTSSYGAGLTRHLHAEGIAVVEVDRPNRQRRRRKGKSDPEDAISAARAAFSGDANGSAKTQDGNVEAIRVLRVARTSARSARSQALNQMRSLVSTAPEPIRGELRGLSVYRLLARASTYRPGTGRDVVSLTKFTLRRLARRAIELEDEIKGYNAILEPLVSESAPELVSALGPRHRT
jgi:transposase